MNTRSSMTIKECESYIRNSVFSTGLVFRKSKRNNSFYVFSDRKTKEIVISNVTLNSALNNVESGYLSCYDKETQTFNRQQLRNLGLID